MARSAGIRKRTDLRGRFAAFVAERHPLAVADATEAFTATGGDRTPNDESKIAAVGAACATDQGRYWDYTHWVYANQDGENNGGFARDRLNAVSNDTVGVPLIRTACRSAGVW